MDNQVLGLELVSHGVTEALRAARFPDEDDALTEAGRRALTYIAPRSRRRIAVAPERRARETAEVCGVSGATDTGLRDLDSGSWRGTRWADLPADAASSWLTDPAFTGHGGEAVTEVLARTRDWLAQLVSAGEPTVAFTHPAVVRAVLVLAVDAPPAAFWRFDVAPGSVTRLHYRGAWTVRSHGG